MLGSRLGLCATFVCALLGSRDAVAWTCAAEPPGWVLPPPTVAAPRNVQPVVRVETSTDASPNCGYGVCSGEIAEMELWTAPRPGRPRARVPAAALQSKSGNVVTFVLRPQGLLEPLRRYEVRARLQAGAPIPTMLLGSFRTGSIVDREAPAWKGLSRADYHPLLAPTKPKRSPGVITLPMGPQQTDPFIEVFGPQAIDDQAGPGALSYGVWLAPEGKAPDYEKPPAGFFRAPYGPPDRLFVAGAETECMVHALTLPSSGKVTLGVRAVDLAGNQSPASETTLDLGPPPAPARRK